MDIFIRELNGKTITESVQEGTLETFYTTSINNKGKSEVTNQLNKLAGLSTDNQLLRRYPPPSENMKMLEKGKLKLKGVHTENAASSIQSAKIPATKKKTIIENPLLNEDTESLFGENDYLEDSLCLNFKAPKACKKEEDKKAYKTDKTYMAVKGISDEECKPKASPPPLFSDEHEDDLDWFHD